MGDTTISALANPKHPVNEVLSWDKLLIYGIQHVLAMYVGAVAVPLIVGGALKMSQEQLVFLINADLFTCGIATIIQTVGFWKFGIRIPVIQGVTFVCVSPMIAIGSGIINDIGPQMSGEQAAATAMVVIFVSIIISGIFALLVAPIMGMIVRLFPPVVTGSVILAIGLNLIGAGLHNFGGQGVYINGQPAQYGDLRFLLIGFIVVLVVILGNKFFTGFLKNISVLIGFLVGYIIAIIAGFVSGSEILTAKVFSVDLPFGLNMPGLGGSWLTAFASPAFGNYLVLSIITFIIVMIITMIESTGDYIAIGEAIDLPVHEHDIAAGIRADGLSTIIGGCLNAFQYTAFAQNVGLVAMTGVRSRFVVTTAGVILVILGLIPKLAAVIASVPAFVIGGAAVVLFASVAGNGIKTLAKAELDKKPNNVIIVSLSVAAGLIPVAGGLLSNGNMLPFLGQLPPAIEPLTTSGISLAAIVAVVLNLFFNGYNKKEKA